MTTQPEVTVVGIDLTDLGPDGEADPFARALVDLACAAARVALIPRKAFGARVALHALQETLTSGAPHLGVEEGLPESASLIGHVLALIDQAAASMAGGGDDG